ncbi:MAG TPA: SUMF1/EgtB/PvdO family nonheme iron enzyme [Bacteriovoracaceae bacterium]|nr:SUMF1/EgtB/PvdO family nonheme iron enzyme [Bacteriovoracaceae bacterium]
MIKLLLLLLSLNAFALEENADVFFGLRNANWEDWKQWHSQLLARKNQILSDGKFNPEIYDTPKMQWSSKAYRQYMLFMYDQEFYANGKYKTDEYIKKLQQRYGKIHSVILWHAYPQVGFDNRTQFDFYENMPGGLDQLKIEVAKFHQQGIKVFLNYNPWDVRGDQGSKPEDELKAFKRLTRIIQTLDADGVLLDTMADVPHKLFEMNPGIVFSSEMRLRDEDFSLTNQTWAQWQELGQDQSSIQKLHFLDRRHMSLTIRRWDTDRKQDLIYSFFNGTGIVVWDSVFGTWNPYSYEDRKLMAQTGFLLDSYADVFINGNFSPLIPSGHESLDVNFWKNEKVQIFILRNRSATPLIYSNELDGKFHSFYGEYQNNQLTVPANGMAMIVADEREDFSQIKDEFQNIHVSEDTPVYSEQTPIPRIHYRREEGKKTADENFALIPAGNFKMHISHKKRESGCHPFGSDRYSQWGWYFENEISHNFDLVIPEYFMKKTSVTNQEYVDFLVQSGYWPQNDKNFLAHLPRRNQQIVLPPELANFPVTYISLNDAWAYADFNGERLPREDEWQWAAQSADKNNLWPWGNQEPGIDVTNLSMVLTPVDSHPQGATEQGLLNMSGNIWEWTDGEYSDDHTRFTFLRGGVYLPSGDSVWYIPRGPRPNSFHAKYLLMDESLDRSETIGFRTIFKAH